jgi:hypothetical protein
MSAEMKNQKKRTGKTSSRPVGRPKARLSVQQIEKLASYGLTQEEVADFFGVSVSTIAERPEFSEAHKKGRQELSQSIKRRQYEMAMNKSSNPARISAAKTMLIWLGKQYCGQKERSELSGPNDESLFIRLDK